MNASEKQGMSALAFACQNEHEDIVRYLVEQGADVNAPGDMDRTPLMAAASNGCHLEILRFLVEHGANVNARGELGWTALIWAAREGCIECVKYLLSQGANPNIRARGGETIIELTQETDSSNRQSIIHILKTSMNGPKRR